MRADEIKEWMENIAQTGGGKTLAAYIAVVATLGGNNAAEDKANENIHASDTWVPKGLFTLCKD
jgi:hypothetical protein